MQNWYAICLNEWIFDKRIKNELNLLLYISSLTAEKWYCYANNKHFAEKFWIHEIVVSRKLSKLQEIWLIKIELKYREREITSREIFIVGGINEKVKGVLTKKLIGINEKVNHNITSNNITSNNNKKIYKKEIFWEFQNVFLSKEESFSLSQKFWEKNKNTYIENLSCYIEQKWKNYKSHYATILNWMRRDRVKPILDSWPWF